MTTGKSNGVRGSAKNITLICGNHKDDSIQLKAIQGPKSIFYACPKYTEHEEHESMCANRISINDWMKLVEYLNEKIYSVEAYGGSISLTNSSFRINGIQYDVLSHDRDTMSFVIRVLNNKSLKGRMV